METWWRCIKLREVSTFSSFCVISLAAVIYRWFRCRGGGSHNTSPQPDPAVSKSGFLICRRPQGLKFTTGYPPPSKEPHPLQSQLRVSASQSLPGEILPSFCPHQVCGLSDLVSVLQGSAWCTTTVPYSQINHTHQHRKGERSRDGSLKWEWSSFKNTVGYVTPLSLHQRHQGIWLMFGLGIGSICVATSTVLKKKKRTGESTLYRGN